MNLHLTETGTVFALLLAFYVFLHCALTIGEIRRTEKASFRVPTPFAKIVSLAEHRKAVDYNADVMQCDLFNALLGALIAVLCTFASGLNVLLAAIEEVWGQGLFAQLLLVATVTALLALVDLPMCWWREFRINELYGYERTNPSKWMRNTLKSTLIGWICEIPILSLFVVLLKVSSYQWWLAASLICTLWFCWLWLILPVRIGFGSSARPMPEGPARTLIEQLLADQGLAGCEVFLASRPKNSIYGDGVFARRKGVCRLVLYDFVPERLQDPEQVLAIAAIVIGRHKLHLPVIRTVLSSVFMFCFWGLLAAAFTHPEFYETLGVSARIGLRNGKPLAGLVICMLIVAAPILLYPLVFVIHFFTRSMDYLADGWAVKRVGGKRLAGALIHLYRDWRITLEPGSLYSLANHRRPHITQRVRSARIKGVRLQAKRFREKLEDPVVARLLAAKKEAAHG